MKAYERGRESFECEPWCKYRIEINSESIRNMLIHSDICNRANANHSEPIRKTFCISFDEKRSINQSDLIRLIPRHESEWIRSRIDPNRIFNENQSELFRPWIHSNWFWLEMRFGSIWYRIDSDWPGLKTWFFIGSDSFRLISRN